MTRLLLTRPLEDAHPSANKLTGMGHSAVCAPMIEIQGIGHMPDGQCQSYIITSRNAVRHGLKKLNDRSALIFAVGPRSATAAREAGFSNIIEGDRDAKALTTLVEQYTPDEIGPICHLAARHVAFDITTALKAQGYDANWQAVYDAVPTPHLETSTRQMLDDGKIEAALFYSARTATIFEAMIKDMGKTHWLEGMIALSLSAKVDKSLKLRWKKRLIAPEPSENALFDLI